MQRRKASPLVLFSFLTGWMLFAVGAASPLYGQSFAERFNPSGNPVGGGAGYTAIPEASSADYVLPAGATAADLLALAQSYDDEATGQTVTPSSAAAPGTLIFIDPAAEINLDGYNRITFNAGVTLASGRGQDLGGGGYAPGALLQRGAFWPNTDAGAQLDALFMAWDDGRLTGFRAQGPFDLRGPNAVNTRDWLGGATFFAKRAVDGTFELDNNEIYAWPDFAVWWYHATTGDVMHHNWVHHNRQVGWGYGLYPGRPRNPDEEAAFVTEYNLFQENKHSVDHNSARPFRGQKLVWTVRGNVFLGVHGQSIVHGHVNKVGGCSYAGWKTRYVRNMILQPGDPPAARDMGMGLPPVEGELTIEDLYLDRDTRAKTFVSKYISGSQVDPKDPSYDPDWDASCAEPHGPVAVDIHTNLNGATLPSEGSVPSATTLTEGEPFTLSLSGSSDADGHRILYHEILWGDGRSVTDPAHREIAYGASAAHAFAESGTYIVRVTAFNEHGLPSRETHHKITVAPASERPLFVAFVGTDWPGQEGQRWPGYYSARLLVNGHVVMGWRDVATFEGYERVAWDAAPIQADSTFEMTMELRADRTIADPNGTEPGGVEVHVDRFYLFGRTGTLYDEDLFFSSDRVGDMMQAWGGGGSSSLFDRHDRAIGPSYGYALTIPQDRWEGRQRGDLYRFTTKVKGLDALEPIDDSVALPDLLAWYPMEERGATAPRTDAHQTTDLVVADGDPVAGAVPGLHGRAVDLGAGGRLRTRSDEGFPLDLARDFTVVSWVYVPDEADRSGAVWRALGGASQLKLKTVPWKNRYAFVIPVHRADGTTVRKRIRLNGLARQAWQMVTARYDASAGVMRLRIDDQADAEVALPGPLAGSEQAEGGWWGAGGGLLRLDEQSVWQAYLPDERVAWLYNGGAGLSYAQALDGGGAPPNQAPVAQFAATCAGLTCDFADESGDEDGTVQAWTWDFGEGSQADTQAPSHIYDAPGSYAVQLTVTDDDSATATTTRSITVEDDATDDEAHAPPVSQLVAWHTMNEEGRRAARTDVHGAADYSNIVSRPQGEAEGLKGRAVKLGNGDLRTTNAPSAFPLDVTQDFTIATWVYLPSGTSARPYIWRTGSGAANIRIRARPDRRDYSLTIRHEEGTDYIENSRLMPDRWQLVVLRHEAASNTVRLRVDETEVASELPASLDGPSAGEVRVMGKGAPVRLDEQSLWQAHLSDAEVDWLYNAGAGRSYDELGGAQTDASLLSLPASQAIDLQAGWNYISSYVIPDEGHLEAVFGDVLAKVALVRDGAGNAFVPEKGINEIGTWNAMEAYAVYATASATLRIQGTSLSEAPASLKLARAWNHVPYLRAAPLPIERALGSIAEHVVLVKNNAGAVWLPAQGINEIGVMQPGQGYKVYLAQPAELKYPSANAEEAMAAQAAKALAAPGVASSAVALVFAGEVRQGQRVSAWTPDRRKVGEGTVQHGGAAVVMLRGKEAKAAPSGARPGEVISFEIEEAGTAASRQLAVASMTDALSGSSHHGLLRYQRDALYLVRAESVPQAFRLGRNYPNPFRRATTITYSLPESADVELSVYDVLGRRVADLVSEKQEAGSYDVVFAPSQLGSGVYFYRLQAGPFVDGGTMTLVR